MQKRNLTVFSVKYKCPKCGHLTELPCVEDIYNSQDFCPVECNDCGTKFRKEELLRFTRHKAAQMVKDALARMQKHISSTSDEPVATILPIKKKTKR